MQVDTIILSEDPAQDLRTWLEANPDAVIKFILGNVSDGRLFVLY